MSWTVLVLPSALLLLLPLPDTVSGLSCRCVSELCEYPTRCQYGMEMDACHCCTVCKKGPREVCGGPFDIDGHCGYGLVCYKNVDKSDPLYDQMPGVCRWADTSHAVTSRRRNTVTV
ncbi:hypothetical protein OTU49_000521 [Cherax quadricarinatus]|uniref:IGFBP N-terminal domain-containing protein n=1 Tax=Cherax quadricarinatus TaxID=27406 RepID=A0AAW0XL16_CHEQU